ncbi:MAG: SufD family Fe-S cluster assembly protein [archaeon]
MAPEKSIGPEKIGKEIEKNSKDTEESPNARNAYDMRKALAARANALPDPTPRDELWRYTRIDKIDIDGLMDTPDGTFPAAEPQTLSIEDSKKICSAVINIGKTIDIAWQSAEFTEAGISIGGDACEEVGWSLKDSDDKIALRTVTEAFVTHTATVAPDTRLDKPILFIIDPRAGPLSVSLDIGQDSAISIIEDITANPGSCGLAYHQEIRCGDRATVDVSVIQDLAPENSVMISKVARAGKDSVVRWFAANIGGGFSRMWIDTLFEGKGGEGRVAALTIGDGDQQGYILTNAIHKAPSTTCTIDHRSVLAGKSKGLFRGNIAIRKGAQGTSSFLTDHVLKISPDASSDSIPALEIDANEVIASHASTTERLDDESMFYLMSRGIPRDHAEELVVQGFMEPVIMAATHQKVADHVRQRLKEKVFNRR